MKARIKKTGEIINIADYTKIVLEACDSYGAPLELSPEEVELIQEKTTEDEHWQDVREKAATACLEGLLSNFKLNGTMIEFAKCAVEYADALVEQLKKNLANGTDRQG